MTPETPAWETEEEKRWRSEESEPPPDEGKRAPVVKSPEEQAEAEENEIHRFFLLMQWAFIGVINTVALLNVLDVIPSLYPAYQIGGFDLMMRCLFSDIIADFQRKKRHYPIRWWVIAYFFPVTTLLYCVFVPYDGETPKHPQFLMDAGFAAACLLAWYVWR